MMQDFIALIADIARLDNFKGMKELREFLKEIDIEQILIEGNVFQPKNEELIIKICDQLNELLLKVKRGEIGMGEAEGCECLMCGKQCKNEGVYCSDCYDKDR